MAFLGERMASGRLCISFRSVRPHPPLRRALKTTQTLWSSLFESLPRLVCSVSPHVQSGHRWKPTFIRPSHYCKAAASSPSPAVRPHTNSSKASRIVAFGPSPLLQLPCWKCTNRGVKEPGICAACGALQPFLKNRGFFEVLGM